MKKDKILFVDDEKNILLAIERQFRSYFDCHFANSGSEALIKLYNEGPFAVIVSGILLFVCDIFSSLVFITLK